MWGWRDYPKISFKTPNAYGVQLCHICLSVTPWGRPVSSLHMMCVYCFDFIWADKLRCMVVWWTPLIETFENLGSYINGILGIYRIYADLKNLPAHFPIQKPKFFCNRVTCGRVHFHYLHILHIEGGSSGVEKRGLFKCFLFLWSELMILTL